MNTEPSEAPAPPEQSFRLYRARERHLGGVAGGLAAATGLDPTLVRFAVTLGGLTGWGAVAYLVAWAALPEEDAASGRELRPASDSTARVLRIGLVVVAGLGVVNVLAAVLGVGVAILGSMGALFNPFAGPLDIPLFDLNPSRPWLVLDSGVPVRGILGVALMAGGAYVLLGRRSRMSDEPPDPSPSHRPLRPSSPPAATSQRQPPPAPPWRPSPQPGPALPRRVGPDWLLLALRVTGWSAVLWFLLACAAVGALWASGAVRFRWPGLVVAGAVGALATVVTALLRTRRRRVLAGTFAVLVVPAILVSSLGRWTSTAGFRESDPVEVDDLDTPYRHAVGIHDVDLTELELPPGRTVVHLEMGAGQLVVRVPWGVHVEAAARVGVGRFSILGQEQAGLTLNGTVSDRGEPGASTLEIQARVSAGRLTVTRADPPPTTAPERMAPSRPGTYLCDIPAGGGPARCRPA